MKFSVYCLSSSTGAPNALIELLRLNVSERRTPLFIRCTSEHENFLAFSRFAG